MCDTVRICFPRCIYFLQRTRLPCGNNDYHDEKRERNYRKIPNRYIRGYYIYEHIYVYEVLLFFIACHCYLYLPIYFLFLSLARIYIFLFAILYRQCCSSAKSYDIPIPVIVSRKRSYVYKYYIRERFFFPFLIFVIRDRRA